MKECLYFDPVLAHALVIAITRSNAFGPRGRRGSGLASRRASPSVRSCRSCPAISLMTAAGLASAGNVEGWLSGLRLGDPGV